jgi:hypothetical protein
MGALAAHVAWLKRSLHKLLARNGKARAKTIRCAARKEPETLRPVVMAVNSSVVLQRLWISAVGSY